MEPFPRTYVPLREVNWRIVVALIALNTICLFFYRQLDYVANALHRPPLLTFSEEGVGGLAGVAIFPLVYWVAIRFPLLSAKWRRNLLVHLVAVCLISLVHTSLIVTFRAVFFPLLGLPNQYGYIPTRYPMEFSHFFIYYWVALGFIYLFHEVRFARQRELQQARLETSLAQAQLQNLQLQLEPHFLFNALNAISATIYENPRVADEMIGFLGELLRQLLKSDRAQEVPLADELETLHLYTRIMQARLEHRLKLTFEIDDSVKQALVPQFILQPLVENAIRYGIDPVTFHIDIAIQAHRENDRLVLILRDHGPGLDRSAVLTSGIGLRNTTERLLRLYGDGQSFEIRNADEGGGVVVKIRLPFQVAPGNEEATTHEEARNREPALT